MYVKVKKISRLMAKIYPLSQEVQDNLVRIIAAASPQQLVSMVLKVVQLTATGIVASHVLLLFVQSSIFLFS